MEVAFKVNAQDLQKKLKSIAEGYASFDQPLRQVKDFQLKEIHRQFTSQGTAITSAWRPLSARTIADRIRSGYGAGPILQRTGKLKSSFQSTKLTRNELNIGSSAKYYQFHQVGTKKIPQRQMLGHSRAMIDKVVDIMARYINQLTLNG